jgi:hypothetical protein
VPRGDFFAAVIPAFFRHPGESRDLVRLVPAPSVEIPAFAGMTGKGLSAWIHWTSLPKTIS